MPLIDDPVGMGFVHVPALPTPENQALAQPVPGEASVTVGSPDFRSVMEAELETNNTVASMGTDQSGMMSKFTLQAYDPDFDLGEAIKGTGYENNPSLFVTARNKAHVDAIAADLYREERNREIIEHSSWGQYIPAMVFGQVSDPVNLIGGLSAIRAVGKLAVGSALKRGAIVAADAALSTTAQEGVLQATQQTRTGEESAIAIGGSMLLGGLIGGLGSKLLERGEREAIEKALETEFHAERPMPRGGAQSVGAAANMVETELPAPTLKGSMGAGWFSQKMGPVQRTVRSSFESTRRAVNELAETPYIFNENEAGQVTAPRGDALQRPGTVQTRLGSVWESRMMPSIYAMRDLYLDYRGTHATDFAARAKAGANDPAARSGEALSEIEFREAVTDALNNGGKHEIPQVARAASNIREHFLKFVEEDGVQSGVVKEGADVVPRAYLGPKIVAERLRFRDIVLKHLKGRRSQQLAELDAAEAKRAPGAAGAEPVVTKAEETLRLRALMEDGELLDLADAITTRLHTRIEGRTAHDAHLVRDADGFLKEEALLTKEDFAIPYNDVKEFLQRDSEMLMRMMHRSMIPDIEIALRFGSADMADAIKAIQKEAAERMNATTDPKERAKINKQAERDVRDLASMRDRLNGRYALPDDPTSIAVRAWRFARDAATVTKMGASAFASISETGRLVTARGISAVFSDLIYPAMMNWGKFLETAGDARIATHALDHYTSARAMAMADGAEDWGNLPKVDRFSREATKTFMRFTGLAKLTDWQKSMAGMLSMKSILEASEALAGGGATSKQITLLSRLGISKENAGRIAEQFKKHGSKEDRLWAPEAGKWDDDARAAREAFLGGLRAEVNRLITTPGLDTPNMAQGELGKLIFQFKSFAISSYERVLVSGLQHNDVPFWTSVVTQITLAMMVNEARKAVFEPTSGKSRKPLAERWNDPAERNQMFMDAVDKSGTLGWLGDINATMDRVASMGLSTKFGTGGEKARGLADPGDLIKQFAGPGAGQAADTTLFGVKLAQKLAGKRNWTEADTRQMERVIPLIGLPYIRLGLEALGAEQAVNRQMGATAK